MAFYDEQNIGIQGYTPDQYKKRKTLAEALIEEGTKSTPIQHWAQGGDRLLKALYGTYLSNEEEYKAQQAQRGASSDAENSLFGNLMGGGATPQAVSEATPAVGEKQTIAMNDVMDYLVKEKGFTPEQASGKVGNFMQESGLNTAAVNKGDGRDGSDSIGIGQWNGTRAQALRQFAENNKRDVNDYKTQVDFALNELDTTEKSTKDRLMQAKTPQEAATAFVGFERPRGYTPQNPAGAHGYQNRVNYAQQAYKGYLQRVAGGQGQTTPQGQPQAPVQVADASGAIPQTAVNQVAAASQTPQQMSQNTVQPTVQPSVNQQAEAKKLIGIMNNPWLPQGYKDAARIKLQQSLDPLGQEAKALGNEKTRLDIKKGQFEQSQQEIEAEKRKADLAKAKMDTERKVDRIEIGKDAYGNPVYQNVDAITKQPLDIADPNMAKPKPAAPADYVSGLRKEVQTLPSYKNYSAAISPYKSITSSANTDNKAADLNIVYGLAKIFDPTSVVREGEIQMANSTAGVQQMFQGYLKSLAGDGRLTPETRQGLLNEAKSRMEAFKEAYDQDVDQYRTISDDAGIPHFKVIPKLPELPSWEIKAAKDAESQMNTSTTKDAAGWQEFNGVKIRQKAQ